MVYIYVWGVRLPKKRPYAVPSAYSVVRMWCRPRVLPYAHTDEIMVEYLFHFTGKANR